MAISDELKRMTFKNRAEEAAWFEANEGALAEEFEKATADGKARPAMIVIRDAASVAKIRLSARDVAKARAQADCSGVSFEAYVKALIHEALEKAHG